MGYFYLIILENIAITNYNDSINKPPWNYHDPPFNTVVFYKYM